MHIMAFGDSLTAGYDVPPASGWLARIQRQRPAWTIQNFGICGDSLAGVVARIPVALRTQTPDLIWIMAGTNDILTEADSYGRAYTNPDAYLTPLRRIVDRLETAGIAVLIGAPPLITKDSVYTGWQTLPAWEISRAALRRYAADLHAAFAGHVVDFTVVLTDDRLYDDGVHPDIYGYARMAQAALPYFDAYA